MARKDANQLLRKVRDDGWDVRRRRNGHYGIRPPEGGEQIIISNSGSDYRAILNMEAHLRRAGLPSLARPPKAAIERDEPMSAFVSAIVTSNAPAPEKPKPEAVKPAVQPVPDPPESKPGDPYVLALAKLGMSAFKMNRTTKQQMLALLAKADTLGLSVADLRQILLNSRKTGG